MKKALLLLLALFPSLMFAQYIGSGYYRVSNLSSGRDIWVVDCTGGIYGTSADAHAIQLKKDKEGALSSPMTIIYIDDLGNGLFNLSTQGTGIYQILNYYVSINVKDATRGIMTVEATKAGLNFSLGDEGKDYGFGYTQLTIYGKSTNNRWVATPVSSNSDNYFGVKPVFQTGGKYYAPFYADFAFKFASSGMKAYTVSEIDNDISAAVIKEITSDIIPARTPVLIECSSADVSNNRLDIIKSTVSPIGGNKLAGNFFNYDEMEDYAACPGSITKFDAKTMRVFNINKEGKLTLSTDESSLYQDQFGDWPNVRFLQPNSAYLPVLSDTPSELHVITAEEYKEYKDKIEAERAKEENQVAYKRLNEELTNLKQQYQVVANKITTECADVAQLYKAQLDDIQSKITTTQHELEQKYEAIELNTNSELPQANEISQALMAMLRSAQDAQQQFNTNQEVYSRLCEKISQVEMALNKTEETILTECPLVANRYVAKLKELSEMLASRKEELIKLYEATALKAESNIMVEDIMEMIEKTLSEAKIAQDIAAGVDITLDNNGKTATYTLQGVEVTGKKLPKGLYIKNGKKLLIQ